MGMGQALVSRRDPLRNPTVPPFPGPVSAQERGPAWYQASTLVTAQSKTVVPSQWGPSPHLPRTGGVMDACLSAVTHTSGSEGG